jgi:probable phosphoglycerate mutase
VIRNTPSEARSAARPGVRVTLVRHAQTVGNAAGIWQGRSDSELSAAGKSQVEKLASRRASVEPTLVISSDLGRTVATVAAFGRHERDRQWREFDLGVWDGLSRSEIEQRFPDELTAARWGADFSIEGGETMVGFMERVGKAFDVLVERLDDGDHAVVVTHGGVIQVLTSMFLGSNDGPPPLRGPDNTSLTSLIVDGPLRQVNVYNDVAHLGGPPGRADGTRLLLFRHGESEANVAGRWQGRSESGLTSTGRAQARALALAAPGLDRVLTSPASRARETALEVASRQELVPEVVEDLVEIDFGSWEGLTGSEARELAPTLFDRIHVDGHDEPRGGTGETFTGAADRLRRAIDATAAASPGETVGIFTHGGVTRAYVAGLLGIPFRDRNRIPVMRNSACARIEFENGAPVLAAYNVAHHLDN